MSSLPNKQAAYYRRLGSLVPGSVESEMRMSRARQICRTWRSHLAWHLVNALGMRKEKAR